MKMNQRIEHTLLDPRASLDDIENLHRQARENGFRSVCVSPYYLKPSVRWSAGQDYKVITVVDYPFGYSNPLAKVEAIKKSADLGADGVDVVINYQAAINEDWSTLDNEVQALVHAAHMRNVEVKLILESSAYSSKILQKVVEVCTEAKPDYLKTNTGNNNNVTSVAQIVLIKRFSKGGVPIKASGGIRSRSQADELVSAGAELLGASGAISW